MNGRRKPLWAGMLISLGSLGLFGFLALNIQGEGPLTEFDRTVNERVHQINQETPEGVQVFDEITGSFDCVRAPSARAGAATAGAPS